jgi:RNA polymerase sigma factor for flagellar operon FliA
MMNSNLQNLWKRYKFQNDPKAREQLILSYAYLAKYVVDRMPLQQSAVVGYDDLISYATLGLIDAVERFDLERDVKFETYAITRIRGAVLDALKALNWLPRSLRSEEQKIRKGFAELEAKLGRPATDEEVASALGITVDELQERLAAVAQSAVLSLEELVMNGEEVVDSFSAGDACSTRDPQSAVEQSEKTRLLAKAISELPEKEKLIISLYYSDGLTLKEIAAILGVTESRACQLHSKAVIRLHGKLARHADLLLTSAT